MRKIKEILRLKHEAGLTNRQIAQKAPLEVTLRTGRRQRGNWAQRGG